MNWTCKISDAQQELLDNLRAYGDISADRNPITNALKSGDFLERYGHLKIARNRTQMSRLAVICQMEVYDRESGPDGDGQRKGLRRQWYTWYKTRFAQPYHKEIAPGKEFNGTGWAGRMSQTYGWLVDNLDVTYRDLWVDDASRMMERTLGYSGEQYRKALELYAEHTPPLHQKLFENFHIIVAVEKDSLYADFRAAARALGASVLVSGKGKMSKAATERFLRNHFGWTEYTDNLPLIFLHISDHDYDGEQVIGPTFAEQARRYVKNVYEARVGIDPSQVENWQDDWYEVKTGNSAYIRWAESKGLFLATCLDCSHAWATQSADTTTCPECDQFAEKIDISYDQPHGFEVEALPTRVYYALMVKALLSLLPFDWLVGKLRDACKADEGTAARNIQAGILEKNKDYQNLLAEFNRLEEIKAAFENKIVDELSGLGAPLVENWRNDDDDPKPQHFQLHVKGSDTRTGPWRPFSQGDRTAKLVGYLRKREAAAIAGFENESLDW